MTKKQQTETPVCSTVHCNCPTIQQFCLPAGWHFSIWNSIRNKG